MIFWTTWMMGILLGFVCLAAAIDRPDRKWLWLGCSYFSMASGVVMSMIDVSL